MKMRVFSVACIVVIGHTVPANGQREAGHHVTRAPFQARFEIFQSESAPRWTFRLDRFNGQIDELVDAAGRGYLWQEMVVPDRPEILAPTGPRFQLLTSASQFGARHTILLDTETGKTWILNLTDARTSRGGLIQVWTPLR
jgi:hypothetical protein